MSAHDDPAKDEAWPVGTPDWADFDADLLDTAARGRGHAPRRLPSTGADPLATMGSGFDLGSESEGDLDLGATFAGNSFSRPLGVAPSRRAHAFSAAGAGLAVVLALAIHAATDGASTRRAPAGAGTLAHVSRPSEPHHTSRVMVVPPRAGAPRRRATSAARSAASPASERAAPETRAAIASPPSVTHSVPPAAEFGFER
jgi:hypothetical protein